MNFKLALFWVVLAAIFPAQATAQLTEADVVRRGLENPQLKDQLDARLDAARGEVLQAGRWDNPSIEYSREQLDLPGGESEESTLWLRQQINIAGVKGLERKAAAKSLEAEEFYLAMEVRLWKKLLREEFYKSLAARQKSAALEHLETRLQAIGEMVKQRAEKGDASRFDALRIEKELYVVSGKSASAEANFLSLRNSLFAILGSPAQSLKGNLLPPATVDETVQWPQHPRLLAMQSEQQSAELKARAAGREFWPELTLGVGRKELNEPALAADGSAIAISITIPLFDHGQGEKQISASRARQLKAESGLLRRQLEADYQSALQAYPIKKRAASELETLVSSDSNALGRLAEASYQAGELGVMALLDAYQADLETTGQYIDTALEARLVYIQLQFLRGE